jgi:hypothetical protein
MKRLILTTSDSGAGCLRRPGIADMIMPFGQRFSIGEQLPPDAGIDSLTMASSPQEQADNEWLLDIYNRYVGNVDSSTSLIDLCDAFDVIDLWIDPDPNAQLILIWLLDYFRPHETVISKMNLVQADVPIHDLCFGGRCGIAAARHQDTDRTSRDRPVGMEGLSRADAARMVRSSFDGFKCAAAAPAGGGDAT